MASEVTAKEICDSVPKHLLDNLVSERHIHDIASHMKDWQELYPYLYISESEASDILLANEREPKLQRIAAIRKWREVYGPRATYRRLIVIFCKHRLAYTALKLKQLLEESGDPDQPKDPILDSFQNYLRQCYSEIQHPSFQQWPFLSSENYSELELLEGRVDGKSKSTEDHNQPSTTVSFEHLLDDKQNKKGRKVVMIEGLAGAGKTTLTFYALKEWAAGRLFQDIKLLIHVSLSDPLIRSAKELADIIPHYDHEMRRDVVHAIAKNHHEHICFLFEGCDEAPDSLWNSFLGHFIKGTGGRSVIPSASFILTSRPSNAVTLNLSNIFTRKIIIKGFKSLESFITSCFKEDSDGEKKLLKALEMKPELRSLCHLPLNAVILVYIHNHCEGELPTTRTGLFDPLVRNFLFRHLQSRKKQEQHHDLDSIDNYSEDLPPEVYSSFKRLSKLAYETLLERKTVIDRKTLKLHGITDSDRAFGFLKESLSRKLNGATQCFTFLHLSLQEYFGAVYISELDESNQVRAVEIVYEQNPLSPVLTFYAGLTGLKMKEVQALLTDVFKQNRSLISTEKDISSNPSPSFDKRRQILACMNCMYETQNRQLVEDINLKRGNSEESADFNVRNSTLPLSTKENQYNESGPHRLQPNVELPLVKLELYPTDCLSIGYFVRHACPDGSERLHLDLNACPLGHIEFEALTHELSQPAKKQNVSLDIAEIYLSRDTLMLAKEFLNPMSCLNGLQVDGIFVEDINLLLKHIIEWLYNTFAEETLIQIFPSKFATSNIYHLTLMVRAYSLNTLQLSSPLFGCHQFMSLFCEALKYSRVLQLELSRSKIDDASLLLLASAVCEKNTYLTVLSINDNCYTHVGLMRFFERLLEDVKLVDLCQLNVDSYGRKQLEEQDRAVKQFNFWRVLLDVPDYPLLKLEHHKGYFSDPRKRAHQLSYHRLIRNPKLSTRSPHH